MGHFDACYEFLACGNTHGSIDAKTLAFRNAIEELGVRFFAFCSHVDPLVPPPGAILLHSYPAAWVRTFSEAGYFDFDPVLELAERDPRPFFWDVAFRAERTTAAQKRLLAEAAGLGIAHGFTVPLHLSWLPGTLRASCSVVPERGRINPQRALFIEALAQHLYACMYHAQVARHTSRIKLTPRERQCLALAAHGKTDWDIGHILHLSECTVHTHFQRLMERLGVCTRRQAIAYALVSGEITLTM
ncbi:MAG TPA: LuxR family transcriptional regulator [Steroidobacteraceae bacterium]|nr:LuxR family transcriptional regulator [Steroidobacteraceae bacterium]